MEIEKRELCWYFHHDSFIILKKRFFSIQVWKDIKEKKLIMKWNWKCWSSKYIRKNESFESLVYIVYIQFIYPNHNNTKDIAGL